MAIWQSTFHLVPSEALKPSRGFQKAADENGHPHISDELICALDTRLERGASWWSKDIQGWGPCDGNRLEVGLRSEVRARFDLREPDMHFADAVLWLAQETGCRLVSEEGEVLEPTPRALKAALRTSEAARFVEDPAHFLEQVLQKE
ncbi:MAG TPA: hypothetical protein VFF76_06625 [Holophagaceae bacterium]|nr:hypothetical protein [Holophagaceae bacterium]